MRTLVKILRDGNATSFIYKEDTVDWRVIAIAAHEKERQLAREEQAIKLREPQYQDIAEPIPDRVLGAIALGGFLLMVSAITGGLTALSVLRWFFS